MAHTLHVPAALTCFQRVALSNTPEGLVASLTGPQGSGLVSGLASTDGLAVIPEDVDIVEPGDELEVILLDDAPAGATHEMG